MSKTILLNQNWIFSKEGHDEPVTLPHTWNAIRTAATTTTAAPAATPVNWRNRSCPMATARFCSLTALL
mgnify:CR=1 FL=1